MDHMYTQAADGSGSLQGVWFGELLQLTGAEGLLLAAISTGRRNTLAKSFSRGFKV